MPVTKRGRACDACHAIKIKCELGTTSGGDPPCQRCLRLGKECMVSIPVRQKDRVAELEAKLEALTKLLEEQKLLDSPTSSAAGTPGYSSSLGRETYRSGQRQKKRRLEGVSLDNDELPEPTERVLAIDDLVPRDLQKIVFEKYCTEIDPMFPVASLAADRNYESMRMEYPLLLQLIVFAGADGLLLFEVQAKLFEIVLDLLDPKIIEHSEKSLELVQAIQIAALWYRPHKHHLQTPISQFVQLAARFSRELGIDKYNCAFSINSSKNHEQFNPSDAYRTWYMCYIISALFSLCWRRPPDILWTEEDDTRLPTLEYGIESRPSDSLLCRYVRAEKLCIELESQTGSCFDPISKQSYQNRITDLKAQFHPLNNCPGLRLYESVAVLLLNESILHTSTNKASFAAPFIPERLSVTDFPAPVVVTPEQILSLQAVQDASQATIDLVFSTDIMTIMSLPMVFFTGRAMYAAWMLIKGYIATTASGNTYGAMMDVQSWRIEEYVEKMIQIGEQIGAANAGSKSAIIPPAFARLRDWVWHYKSSYVNSETWSDSGYSTVGLENLDFNTKDVTWPPMTELADGWQYGIEDLFKDL